MAEISDMKGGSHGDPSGDKREARVWDSAFIQQKQETSPTSRFTIAKRAIDSVRSYLGV